MGSALCAPLLPMHRTVCTQVSTPGHTFKSAFLSFKMGDRHAWNKLSVVVSWPSSILAFSLNTKRLKATLPAFCQDIRLYVPMQTWSSMAVLHCSIASPAICRLRPTIPTAIMYLTVFSAQGCNKFPWLMSTFYWLTNMHLQSLIWLSIDFRAELHPQLSWTA